ncbi:putative acetylhydrolase [Podospora australis]|uniref:1-alkyl-2-acetylglycerophosphocholine esterase n=1 Tax=Podospora australis TaxID=1536484 RepID=A0AAN6X2D6_9PEZI|nr:putative acetylhydrolase [Podospora australis]
MALPLSFLHPPFNPNRHTSAPEPPRSFREHFFHRLPPYTGPFHVGFLELEVPARQPNQHFRDPAGTYDLKLDTVLCAIYYPCDFNSDLPKSEQRHLTRKKGQPLSRVPWLGRPRVQTCTGYAKYFNVPLAPLATYMACTSMFTKLPALRNGRLSSRRWPVKKTEGSSSEERDNEEEKQRKEKENQDNTSASNERAALVHLQPRTVESSVSEDKPRFPVIIFSHGLGGSRTLYSVICGELASFGFVVVAMEHRDGSGARTFVNKPPAQDESEAEAAKDELDKLHEKRGFTKKKPNRNGKSYYVVDYIFPKNNARDTSPNNAQGVDLDLRGAQLDLRLAEIEEAYYIMGLINDGKGQEVGRRNLRKKGNIGSSAAGLNGIDWRDWKGRLHLGNVTMMGHSFGGATTVQALRSRKLHWIAQGIMLDPWGPGTPESSERERLQKPVLSIGSEAFMDWTENFERVEKICREVRDGGSLCWMTTIRGSTHLSQTDFAILYPNWMSVLMKTIVNPKRAIYLTVCSALEFLKITLPPEQTRFSASWTDEQLLKKMDEVAEVEHLYRPKDKWMAVRLKIPNEFSLRMKKMVRRSKKGDDVPRHASGKPLRGLINWGAGEEFYCHLYPERELVDQYTREHGCSSEALENDQSSTAV